MRFFSGKVLVLMLILIPLFLLSNLKTSLKTPSTQKELHSLNITQLIPSVQLLLLPPDFAASRARSGLEPQQHASPELAGLLV